MNIYTIIIIAVIVLIAIWRIKTGIKRGLVKELSNMFSILVAVVAGYYIKRGIDGFLVGKYGTVVSTVIIIAIIIALQRMVHFVLNTAKLFTKLPIIKGVDKICGIFAGILETVAIVKVLEYLLL